MLSLILSEVCMARIGEVNVAAACFDEKNKMRQLDRGTQWVYRLHCTLRPQPVGVVYFFHALPSVARSTLAEGHNPFGIGNA